MAAARPPAEKLFKKVNRTSYKGEVLLWYFHHANYDAWADVFHCCLNIGLDRQKLRAILNDLHTQHGFGYTLLKDVFNIIKPKHIDFQDEESFFFQKKEKEDKWAWLT